MAEIIDSTPNAQAYDEEVETLRGRFAANIANIRLFKDNPYLAEMTDEDRNAANADLLVPHHGEQFYDDDKFVYVCQYEKDPITLQTKYVYYSKEKELNEKMNYYVANISAWLNSSKRHLSGDERENSLNDKIQLHTEV